MLTVLIYFLLDVVLLALAIKLYIVNKKEPNKMAFCLSWASFCDGDRADSKYFFYS